MTCGMGADGGGTSGTSAIRATVGADAGSDAAIGDIGTMRRFVRVADGATAADRADGDSGVTPLCRRFTAPREGFSTALSERIRSTAFSVTGFSLSDFSNCGATFGCSVMLGSTVAMGAAAVIDAGIVPACVALIEWLLAESVVAAADIGAIELIGELIGEFMLVDSAGCWDVMPVATRAAGGSCFGRAGGMVGIVSLAPGEVGSVRLARGADTSCSAAARALLSAT